MAEHAHGHHEHGHGHAHGHGHGHGHGHDHWDGDEYLTKPGIKETAASSADNVFYALQRAGLEKHDLVNLDLLEVGCGPGLVTALVAPSFGSVHSIDVSANMLKTFAKQPAAALPNVTYSQHTLHAGSGDDFVRGTPQPSPTPTEPERKERPPREKFDVAIANLVVHHVDNLDQFFKGLMSILKPGGKLILTEFTTLPNGRDPIAEVREKNAAKHAKPEGTVNAPNVVSMTFNPDLLGAILNKYGFENVGGDRRGTILIGEDKDEIPTLYMYASKPK